MGLEDRGLPGGVGVRGALGSLEESHQQPRSSQTSQNQMQGLVSTVPCPVPPQKALALTYVGHEICHQGGTAPEQGTGTQHQAPSLWLCESSL